MSNYAFVVDSSYKPFSLQEMLVPFTAYKEEFEKAETAYTDLTDKADTFKYLSEKLPEGSKARQLYEGYANNLKSQAEDLAHNGLTRANRTALTSLKRRYQGEIGRVAKADEAMEAEKKLRQSLNAQDSSRLYAMDNLSVDDFLDGNNPNLYNISGNELYTRGAAAGKAASSRVYNFGEGNITLGGYYRDVVSKVGYGPQAIAKFREDISSNPELAAAVDSILAERGVTQNLTGVNLERARQSVINGIIDGAVYQENHNPQRDLGVLTQAEKIADTRAKQAQAINMWQAGVKFDSKGNVVADKDNINYQAKQLANEAAQVQMDIMYPVGEDGKRHLSADYKLDKKGNPKIATDDSTDTESKTISTALLKLEKSDLAHNEGFEVTAGGDRKQYRYIGAVSSHGGKWYHGNIGDDNPGHKGWGFLSSSNVENAWGNFSAEGSDSKVMRVLSQSEVESLMTDSGLSKAISDQLESAIKAGAKVSDIQIVEVPNEKDSHKKGYLIAVN